MDMVMWRKSSRSQNDQNCVEVAGDLDRLRDSKNEAELRADVNELVRAIKDGFPAG